MATFSTGQQAGRPAAAVIQTILLSCVFAVQFFQDQGCDMEEMTCERHDELASRTQFVTHTIGRVLGAMDLSVR